MIVRLLVVVAVGLAGCGTSGGPAGSDGTWGPLAVAEGSPTGMEALLSGTVEITDTCVFLRNGDERSLLVWPSEATQWEETSRTIRYSAEGSVELRDGDAFSVGGGGSSEAEDGLDDRVWAESINWAAEPDPSCFTSVREFVGYGPEEAVPPRD